MTKLRVNDVRNDFAQTLNRVHYQGKRVVVERRGKGVAALVPMEDLELLQALEDRIDLAAARKALKEPGPDPVGEGQEGLGAVIRGLHRGFETGCRPRSTEAAGGR